MSTLKSSIQWKTFLVRIILPTMLTMTLFLATIFLFIIPTIENNSLERKREMIRELTNSAWNILAKFEYDEQKGILSREDAQKLAVEQIKNLHYGQQMKDYFWINDMYPKMVIHPYRTDLNGKDLTDYKDPDGKRVFVEFVDIVRKNGSGYLRYMWQWKDDETKIVPKVSYVKGFTPWGWVIGTGIYIEDIKAEIELITHSVIKISLVILFIMAILLTTIILQNYRTEKQRQVAEKAVRDSEEKYRILVESATEGMLMALGGRYIYSNKTISDQIEYSNEEISQLHIYEIFADDSLHPGYRYVRDLIAGKEVPERFEAQLKTKSGNFRDVILSSSRVSIGSKDGFILVATDITKQKETEVSLWESEEKFRTLVNNLNIGVFRRTAGKNSRFVEVNPEMVRLMGYANKEELISSSVSEIYYNRDEEKKLEERTKDLKRQIVKLKKKDGTVFSALIWVVIVFDKNGKPKYYDGIIEDITEIQSWEEKREKLFSEMQNALFFLNRPISSLHMDKAAVCNSNVSIHECIELLNKQHTDALLVQNKEGENVGVLTDIDLRKKMGDNADGSVIDIMSSPVVTIPDSALIFEAGQIMEEKQISHLFVTADSGNIYGVIRINDIASIQKYSPAILLQKIKKAESPEEAIKQNRTLPHLAANMINSGTKIQYVNHLTSIIADVLLKKLIDLAIKKTGQPPVSFSFLVLGSEGRQEQTLFTDQDNAIVYEDVPEEKLESVNKYFLNLGEMVCGWLNDAGNVFCTGDIMAKNPRWCQPLTTWKKYFTGWISESEAEDLLQVKIFFDFRSVYGEESFDYYLREHIAGVVSQHPGFFHLLARNVLNLTPPIGFFGNIVLESINSHGKAFDIKKAMMPIVDYARIYAIHHRISFSNTLERLKRLYELNVLAQQNYQEMVQAYSYLMMIRLRTQAEAILEGGKKPDNYITPDKLSNIEKKLLKEIFSQTKHFQTKLSYDFTGQMGGL